MEFLMHPTTVPSFKTDDKVYSSRIHIPRLDSYHRGEEVLAMVLGRHFEEMARSTKYYQFLGCRVLADRQSYGSEIEFRYKGFDPADVVFDKQLLQAHEALAQKAGRYEMTLYQKERALQKAEKTYRLQASILITILMVAICAAIAGWM